MKLLKLSLLALALGSFPVIAADHTKEPSCIKCCKGDKDPAKCDACCKDKGKECLKDCCKAKK